MGQLTVFTKRLDEDLALKSVEPADTRIKVQILDSGKVLGNSKAYQIQIEIPLARIYERTAAAKAEQS